MRLITASSPASGGFSVRSADALEKYSPHADCLCANEPSDRAGLAFNAIPS